MAVHHSNDQGNDDIKRSATGVAELVRSAAAGDEAAWEAIVARYSGLLWHVVRAHQLSHSEAADVVQTTWLRLVQHVGQIREPETVGAWLATTARREALRALRRINREFPNDDANHLEAMDRHEEDPEAHVLTTEVERMLWRCVDALPERCRRLLRLLMADPPATYEEINAVMDMPVGSIGPTRARCLQCLRRSIERTGILADS